MNEPGPVLYAAWPAPPGVVAFTTLRHGAGVSQAPFDAFNLGLRSGDEPRAVESNRSELRQRFLPSAPHWLRQVHGNRVVRFDAPAPAGLDIEPEADAAVTSSPGTVLATANGVIDENYWLASYVSGQLSARDSFTVNSRVQWLKSGG